MVLNFDTSSSTTFPAIRLVSKGEIARVEHPGEWGFAIEDGTGSGMVGSARLRRAMPTHLLT